MAFQDRYYAYLTDSNEAANRLADDIIRLAPRPDVDEDPFTTGMYLQTVDGREYVLRPFIDDADVRPFPPNEPRARFYLGIAVSHLSAFKDPEIYYPVPFSTIATVGVEGGNLDQRVIDAFSLPVEKGRKPRFPLRVTATEGDKDVFDLTTPGFEPLRASKQFLRGFYEHWNIESLDRRKSWTIDAEAIRNATPIVETPAIVATPEAPKVESDPNPTFDDEDQSAWKEALANSAPPEDPWFHYYRA